MEKMMQEKAEKEKEESVSKKPSVVSFSSKFSTDISGPSIRVISGWTGGRYQPPHARLYLIISLKSCPFTSISCLKECLTARFGAI